MKAASSAPPAVKPTGHKTSVGAAEMLRRLEQTSGATSPEIMEAVRKLQTALEQQTALAIKFQEISGNIPPSPPPPIAPKSGSGDNGEMERRLTALEGDMKDVRERLVRVETKLDTTQQKLDILPSKDFVTSAVSTSANKIIIWVVIALGASQLIPSVALPLLKHFGISQ